MSIGDYDKAIEYCEDSLRKITMNRAYEFKSYIKFYLAEAYYKNGMRDEFLHSFKYTLYSLITFENDGVLRHIANYEMFDKFLNDDGLCKSLVSTIKEKLQRERA